MTDAITATDLFERGELVFEHARARSGKHVYELDECFFTLPFRGMKVQGPFDCLEDAVLDEEYEIPVYKDTIRLWSSRLDFYDMTEKIFPLKGALKPIDVNGEEWEPVPSGDYLQSKGRLVYTIVTEEGSGMWGQYVYKLDGQYYSYDMGDDEVDGPYSSLVNAAPLNVGPATSSVTSSELTKDELKAILNTDYMRPGDVISVNGSDWLPAGPARAPLPENDSVDSTDIVELRAGLGPHEVRQGRS